MYFKAKISIILYSLYLLFGSSSFINGQCPNRQWDFANTGSNYVDDKGKKTVFGNFTNKNSSEYINDGLLYLFGNITNDGHYGDGFGIEVIKTCDDSRTVVSGGGITEFNELTLDNQGGALLQQDVKIRKKLLLSKGIFHTDRRSPAHRLFFLDGSNYSGSSNTRHVNGTVVRQGLGPFIFPTGDGHHLSPIKLSGVNSFDLFTTSYYSTILDSVQYRAKGVFPIDSLDYNVFKVQPKEFWVAQGGQSTRVTLFWTAFSDIKSLTDNTKDLIVVGWDGSKWVNLGRTAIQEAFGTGTLESKNLVPNNYKAFTFGVLDTDGDGIPDSKDPKPLDACDPNPSSEACLNRICVEVQTSVWLEGPLSSNIVGSYLDKMKTYLSKFGYLPGQRPKTLLGVASKPGQPYDTKPWFYSGQEGLEIDKINNPSGSNSYPENTVDWVLVSLRTRPDKASTVCTKSALLLDTGDLYFTEFFDCCGMLENEYYLVIEHRNHLAVMSPTPLSVVQGKLRFDFRTNQSYTRLLGNGQKVLKPGVFAMYAGNGDQVTAPESPKDINANDVSLWARDNGKHSGYYFQDYDLSGDINVHDKAIWLLNNGIFTDVDR